MARVFAQDRHLRDPYRGWHFLVTAHSSRAVALFRTLALSRGRRLVKA